jgi:hypothetical protein
MNLSTRTNQPLHIGQLISQVIMPLSVLNGETFSPADETIRNATSQKDLLVEGGDPVRSAERVPYSPSHQLVRERFASNEASDCPGTTDTAFQVEAA